MEGIKELIDEKKEFVTKTKKAWEKEEAKTKASKRIIRNALDKALKKFGVDRGATHGGDLNGVMCLRMESRIDDIMDEFTEILRTQGNGKEDEIATYCDTYKMHFLLISHKFSLARTTRAKLCLPGKEAEVIAKLEEVIPLSDYSQQRLRITMTPPKRHSFSSHCIRQIKLYRGISEYLEDWVEKQHQFYLKCKSRIKERNRRNFALYRCRQDKINNNPKIKEIQNEVATRSKRPRGENEELEALSAEQKQRKERHARRKKAVEDPKQLFRDGSTTPLKSALQLCIMDRRRELAE